MKYFLFIALAIFSNALLADNIKCNKWQYANLSFLTQTNIENKTVKDVYTFVVWQSPDEDGIWQNNQPLPGMIKTTLTKHFQIKAIDAPSILNKIGMKGWEAYGFNVHQVSKTDQDREWQFKRCRS